MMRIFKLLCLLGLVGIMSCQDPLEKEQENIKEISFYLTDCPFDAEEVNIEILQVSVEDKNGVILDLNTNSGVYNLLDFQNGVDTLLATGNVDFEDIKNVYFEIGDNNSIVVDGVESPLELLQPNDTTIKVKLDLENIQNDDDYLIEFYACTSIIERPDGYFLKPVLKFKGKKGNQGGGSNGDSLEDILDDVIKCYELVFPINFIDEQGVILEANSNEEIVDILVANENLTLGFPFDVVDENAITTTINNEDDIDNLEDCGGGPQQNVSFEDAMEAIFECFEFVYPVSFLDVDGSSITVNDSVNLMDLYDQSIIVDFQYPFSVIKPNGQDFEVMHFNMLNALIGQCEDIEEEEEEEEEEEAIEEFEEVLEDILECFDFVYPVSFVDTASMTFVANDSAEFYNLYSQSFLIDFVYPFSLTQNGQDYIVMDEDMIDELTDDCEDENEIEFEDVMEDILKCYEFVYPVSFLDPSGMTVDAFNVSEVEDLLDQSLIVDFVFPFSVIKPNGQEFELMHSNMLNAINDNCNEEEDEIFDEAMEAIFECYEFVYPVSFLDSLDMTFTAVDSAEVVTLYDQGTLVDFVYPFIVIRQNGQEFNVQHSNMLNPLIEGCD